MTHCLYLIQHCKQEVSWPQLICLSFMSHKTTVIHTCNDVSTAKSTLPSLLRSDAGPIAVIIGKGFSDAEMQDIIAHCKHEVGETKTAWLLPDDDKFTAAMKAKAVFSAGSALPGLIASRAAESLRQNGVVAGKSLNELKGGTYGF